VQKIEIIEYPVPSEKLFDVTCLGKVIHTENVKDVFLAIQHLSFEEENIPEGLREGRWKHFKGGGYKVLGVTNRKKTNERLVIYQQLYDSEKYSIGTLWGRPIDNFLGEKKIGNNIRISRFKFIGN